MLKVRAKKNILNLAICAAAAAYASTAAAVDYTVTGTGDSFSNVGDFAIIEGWDSDQNHGQALQVLSGSGNTVTSSVTAGAMYDELAGNSVSSTTALIFGFETNQSNGNNSADVRVTGLQFTLAMPDGSQTSAELLPFD